MFFTRKPGEQSRPGPSGSLRCSFCGKAEAEVAKLIAGQAGFICDECVRVCTGLVAGDRATAQQAPPASGDKTSQNDGARVGDSARTAYCAFCGRLMPRDEALLVAEQGTYCPACIAADSKPTA